MSYPLRIAAQRYARVSYTPQMFVRFLFVGSFIAWFQRDKQAILADYTCFSPVCDVSFDCIEDDLLKKGGLLCHTFAT
jgi:hypothetical protein